MALEVRHRNKRWKQEHVQDGTSWAGETQNITYTRIEDGQECSDGQNDNVVQQSNQCWGSLGEFLAKYCCKELFTKKSDDEGQNCAQLEQQSDLSGHGKDV